MQRWPKGSVWVSYPLKQGLKQNHVKECEHRTRVVWVSYPLKQGLKQSHINIIIHTTHWVWVSYPLKQGLKLVTERLKQQGFASLSQLSIKTRIETNHPRPESPGWFGVWVSYPLKQGLKLPYTIEGAAPLSTSLSQLSIKTRIETPLPILRCKRLPMFESAIH